MASKGGTSSVRLDAAESLQLFWLHRHLLAEPNLAGRATNEGNTVGVQGLVDRGGAGLCSCHGDARTCGDGLLREFASVTLAERFDDGGLHRKLDGIERDEPYNVL